MYIIIVYSKPKIRHKTSCNILCVANMQCHIGETNAFIFSAHSESNKLSHTVDTAHYAVQNVQYWNVYAFNTVDLSSIALVFDVTPNFLVRLIKRLLTIVFTLSDC